VAIVAGAGAVATASVLALSTFSASAAPTPTAVTVTAPATVTTGHAVTFTASVSPFKTTSPPVVKAGGTVSFTITGSDASTVSCTGGNADLSLNGKGKAVCKVSAGGLLASASPYTVSATYTGDANFGGNSGVLSQTVSSATTHVKLTYDAKPVSGAPTTFTATVTGGGSLPTGTVLFSVSSLGASSGKLKCNPGGNSQPLAPSSDAVPVAQATCALPANWFKVPAPTKTSPHPTSTWGVSATYSGDGNHGTSIAVKQGSSKG